MVGQNALRARDRWIGARLRAIRKNWTRLTLEEAAKRADWSLASLSRTENGIRHVSSEEVAQLVTAYGLPRTQRAQIIADARWDNPPYVLDRALPGIPLEEGVFASYFADAIALTDWSVSLVPWLLQIEDYALAVMHSDGIPPEDARRRWQAIKKQQERLGTIDYTPLVTEAALRRPFGGPAVHRDQLAHLHGLRDRGIGLRIVPDHLPIGVVCHSWLHMTQLNKTPVVIVSLPYRSIYLHDDQATQYDRSLILLGKIALGVLDSRDRIRMMSGTGGAP